MEQLDRKFAELVIKQGLVPREQVERLAEAVRKASALGAATNLPDTLVGKGYLTRGQANALLERIRSAQAKAPPQAQPEPRVTPQPPPQSTGQKSKRSATKALMAGACVAAVAVAAVVVLAPLRPTPTATEDKPQKAYDDAVAYLEQHPDELTAAISQFQTVKERYEGTAWAKLAAARIKELEEEKTSAAIEARLAELKSQCGALIGEERFGEALRRLDLFVKECPSKRAADGARELDRAVRAKARERYAKLARRADAALATNDYKGARAALALVKGFGIPELAEEANRKLAEIDAHEKNARDRARWEEIKARAAELAEAGKYEQAGALLQTAKELQLRGVDELIAREVEAVDRAEEAARAAIKAKYAAAFDAEVRPLLAERSYARAAQAFDKLRARDEFESLADELRCTGEDIGRLAAFWRQVEQHAAGLKPGQVISIGGKTVEFSAYDNGLIRYKVGAAQVGVRLRKMKAGHIIALLPLDLLEDDETRIRAAAFLLYDKDSDPVAAYDLLAKAKPGPDVERYRRAAADKAEVRRFEADEEGAQEAFCRLVAETAKMPSQLPGMLEAFRKSFGHTRFFNEHLADMALLRAAPADPNLKMWEGRRYLLVKRPAFWSEAKLQCELLGGHLLTITSAREQRFIFEEFDANVWLGATDERIEGKWEWVTGEQWSYACWTAGQPDNAWEKEHWAEMVTWGGKPGWNDAPAITRRQYICEWEKQSPPLGAEEWRELAAVLGVDVPRPGAAEYNKRLLRPVSYKGKAVSLEYAVVGIANQLEIPYQWEKSVRLVGPVLAARPVDAVFRDSPADKALSTILNPLDLTYDVDEAGLFIRPAEGATVAGTVTTGGAGQQPPQEDDDFGKAKHISLTTLTPLRSKVGWGALTANRTEDGAREVRIGEVVCREFLYAHADSSIIYEIPKGSACFVAVGACSHPTNKSVRFQVKVDGRSKFRSGRLDRLREGSVSIRVKLPKNARRIELIVDNCGDSDCDWSVWAFPRFVK